MIIPMAPHEAVRYDERTAAEWCNGRFKVEFGGRCVQGRGADKVMLHLMFGIIALFADQLLKATGCGLSKNKKTDNKGVVRPKSEKWLHRLLCAKL
jgi:hypothetical protein